MFAIETDGFGRPFSFCIREAFLGEFYVKKDCVFCAVLFA